MYRLVLSSSSVSYSDGHPSCSSVSVILQCDILRCFVCHLPGCVCHTGVCVRHPPTLAAHWRIRYESSRRHSIHVSEVKKRKKVVEEGEKEKKRKKKQRSKKSENSKKRIQAEKTENNKKRIQAGPAEGPGIRENRHA